MKVRAVIKSFEELVDTKGVEFKITPQGINIVGENNVFVPSMRGLCGKTVILEDEGKNWTVDNQWFIDKWMCKIWEPLYNPLEEEFNKLEGVTIETEVEELVTVMCNDNTYSSFDNTEDVICLRICSEYCDVDYSVGLTSQQWLKLHEQAMKIIDLKKRVDEVEE